MMNSVKGNMSEKSEKEKKGGVSDVGAWAMNVISSVGIIMANKQVMSQRGYDYRFGEVPRSLRVGLRIVFCRFGVLIPAKVWQPDLFVFMYVWVT
jgi:solute carrier family 35 protein E3